MVDNPLNRISVKRGDELSHSKLNSKLVKKLREDRALAIKTAARYTAKNLAREYGVHVRTMEKALSGETWGNVV